MKLGSVVALVALSILALDPVSAAVQRVRGFVYENGVFTSVDYAPTGDTLLQGINDAGEIIGEYRPPNGSSQGFTYTGNAFSLASYPGAKYTIPQDINTQGDIVGLFAYGNDDVNGYLLKSGSFSPVLAGSLTFLRGNNDAGQMVGTVGTNGFVISNSQTSLLSYSGLLTGLTDINNQGVITGYFQNGGTIGSFTYWNGVFETIIDGDFTIIEAINDSGVMIGRHGPPGEEAFIYSGGVFSPLSVPHSTFTVATGINNLGQIVGFWQNIVPEPATWSLLIIGFAITGTRLRKLGAATA